MRKKHWSRKWLSGILITAMMAVNLSSVWAAIPASSNYVNAGPGVKQETDIQAAEDADAAVSETEKPYQEVTIPVKDDGWFSLSPYNPRDLRGLRFEITSSTSYEAGGGGGIYMENWDDTIQYSFNSIHDKIEYIFKQEDIVKLKPDIGVFIWWAWDMGDGIDHKTDLSVKNKQVTLLFDKNAVLNLTPSTVSAGRASGGGSSSGSGSGTSSAGSNIAYNYVAREKGITDKLSVADLCPGYQLQDIVEFTMYTRGGDEWNSFDLYCVEDGEIVKVSKSGGVSGSRLTLKAKPDNGEIFVTVNWLGGNYMLYGFKANVVGHGEPVQNNILKEFTKEEYDVGKGEYFYDIPISIATAMEEIGATFGVDEVKITISLESDGWWNGIVGVSGPSSWIQNEYYTGFSGSASITVVPTVDNFKVGVSVLEGTKGIIKNLKVEKTGNQIESEKSVKKISNIDFAEDKKSEDGFYCFDLTKELQEAWPEELIAGEGEVIIKAEVEYRNCWIWSKLGTNSKEGWKESDNIEKSGTISFRIKPTECRELIWTFLTSDDNMPPTDAQIIMKSLTVEKAEPQLEPEDSTDGIVKINTKLVRGYQVFEDEFKTALREIGISEIGSNQEEVTVTFEFVITEFFNGNIQFESADGKTQIDEYGGIDAQYELTFYPIESKLAIYTDNPGATLVSITVEKTGETFVPAAESTLLPLNDILTEEDDILAEIATGSNAEKKDIEENQSDSQV